MSDCRRRDMRGVLTFPNPSNCRPSDRRRAAAGRGALPRYPSEDRLTGQDELRAYQSVLYEPVCCAMATIRLREAPLQLVASARRSSRSPSSDDNHDRMKSHTLRTAACVAVTISGDDRPRTMISGLIRPIRGKRDPRANKSFARARINAPASGGAHSQQGPRRGSQASERSLWVRLAK